MLSLCGTCQRHVKLAPCPFCGSELVQDTPQPPTPSARSRASLLLGAALVSATVGCNDRSNGGAGPGASSPPSSPTSTATPDAAAALPAPYASTDPSAEIYGAPPFMGNDAGAIVHPPAAVYGGPPSGDVGPPLPKPKPKPPH